MDNDDPSSQENAKDSEECRPLPEAGHVSYRLPVLPLRLFAIIASIGARLARVLRAIAEIRANP